MGKPVVVVGAGLTGLVCARRLHQAGVPVVVVEASSSVGGKMQTDVVDGFRLDRGFQVVFDRYPHLRLELDLNKLALCNFEPGALVWDGKKQREVHRENILQTLFDGIVPMADFSRINALNEELKSSTFAEIWSGDDMPITDYLASRKFSESFVERFVRPFFGGILLDRSLSGSSLQFKYYWKMLDEGHAAIPALGIGAIPDQIAGNIPEDKFVFGQKAIEIVQEGGRAVAVRLAGGQSIDAEAVVVATDASSASSLGLSVPAVQWKSCTTVYFAVDAKPTDEATLVLDGPGKSAIDFAVCTSLASRSLAPHGQHLVAATKIGLPGDADLYFAKSVRYELQTWFPKANVGSWRPLAVRRVSHAQPVMPVGYRNHRPSTKTPVAGLYLAGEVTEYAGSDGAARSGQQAAVAVLDQVWEQAPA